MYVCLHVCMHGYLYAYKVPPDANGSGIDGPGVVARRIAVVLCLAHTGAFYHNSVTLTRVCFITTLPARLTLRFITIQPDRVTLLLL